MAKQKLKELLIDTMKFLGEKHKELANSVKTINGDGPPERVVSATKGTVYTDNQITLGVSQWIKTTDTGNTGWVELTRATNRKHVSNKVWVRRVNERVTWRFGGGKWDWFAVIGPSNTNWQGYPVGNTVRGNPSLKVIHSYICPPYQNIIPPGFRSPANLVGSIYSDLTNKVLGVWKLGSGADGHQFRFEFFEQTDARKDHDDIRVDTVTYLTDDPWPERLTGW